MLLQTELQSSRGCARRVRRWRHPRACGRGPDTFETVDVARAWSGYFQVSAFVSIYTINDTTMETKTPLSRARANPVPLHAPRPRFGRAVTSTGGVFRPPEKSNGRQRQQENGRKSDRRCLPQSESGCLRGEMATTGPISAGRLNWSWAGSDEPAFSTRFEAWLNPPGGNVTFRAWQPETWRSQLLGRRSSKL
jgi:hypothetical protein